MTTFDDFWADFERQTVGGTRPTVLDATYFPEPLFIPEDGITLSQALFATGDLSINVGGRLREDAHLLPPPTSIDEYPDFVNRLAAVNGSETITFTRDYCLRHSPRLANRIRSFVHKYVCQRGIPFPGVNGVFIGGKYRATWIGLHNDFCDTFLIPALGRKRMLLWPPPYFRDAPLLKEASFNGVCYGHLDLDPYRGSAQILPVQPGQILFIPAQWWHYNDLPSPELTMTLSIGVFNNARPIDLVQRAISASMELESSHEQHEASSAVRRGLISSDLAEVGVNLDADRIFERARHLLRLQALLASSSNGVLGCAQWRSAPRDLMTAPLKGREDSPLYLVSGEGSCLLVACGAARRFQCTSTLQKLVVSINSLTAFVLEEIVSQDRPDAEVVLAAVSWLYELGCVDSLFVDVHELLDEPSATS
jgi:hypothetical protein